MKTKIFFIVALLTFLRFEFTNCCLAQNISINNTGTAPNASAILDINARDKGFLFPRLSSQQRNNIASPAEGLFIYNTSVNKLEYWNGAEWIQLSNGLVSATNLPGTANGRSVVISTNNSPADPSAILDVQSTTGGLLIPRMTSSQRDAIVAPVIGLLVYNTNTKLLNFYSSSGWAEICGANVSSATGSVTTSGNVGINTALPHPSAMLDVSSTKAGIAIPRLTSAERDAILSPAKGLMLYNTTTQSINIYDGISHWLDLIAQTSPAAPTAGTHASTQTGIIWNWNAVAGAAGYKYNTVNNYSTAIDNTTNTSFNQAGLNCGTAYSLYVWSYNACGNSNTVTLTKATSSCGSSPCGGVTTMTDARDSKIYNVVEIGTQCWMAQNLNYSTSGSYIPGITEQTDNGAVEKYCYNNLDANCDTYGGLYQWAEMVQYLNGATNVTSWNPIPSGNIRGICPSGWHIPTDAEWCILENFTEVNTDAGCNTNGFRGTNTGAKLKESGTTHWTSNSCGTGCNTVGFSALPAGYRYDDGTFSDVGSYGFFWSSTGNAPDDAWDRTLSATNIKVARLNNIKMGGMSVRCVKD